MPSECPETALREQELRERDATVRDGARVGVPRRDGGQSGRVVAPSVSVVGEECCSRFQTGVSSTYILEAVDHGAEQSASLDEQLVVLASLKSPTSVLWSCWSRAPTASRSGMSFRPAAICWIWFLTGVCCESK